MISFITSPSLSCLEKNDHSLSLCHFGNVFNYNTFDPALSLSILKELKRPQSIKRLEKQLKSFKPKEIHAELKNLHERNFIHKVDSETTKGAGLNLLLQQFVKNKRALESLSNLVAEMKVGLIDLTRINKGFSTELKSIGFKNVDLIHENNLTLQRDLYVVIGTNRHKFLLSKINQTLIEKGKQWLYIEVDNFGGTVGPLFGMDGGACYDCIIDQSKRGLGADLAKESLVDLIEDDSCPNQFTNTFISETVFRFAAIEMLKIVARFSRPGTFDGFYAFDVFNFRTTYQIVNPSPVCPVCRRK